MTAIEQKIADLEKRITALENKRRKAAKSGKPANSIAFDKAIDAWMAGDRKALEKYGELYSYPT
ncbi:MAG: hypothetical protein WC450_08870 [Candidatus Omnitrophota bacterium]|jgi:hypothetical protein